MNMGDQTPDIVVTPISGVPSSGMSVGDIIRESGKAAAEGPIAIDERLRVLWAWISDVFPGLPWGNIVGGLAIAGAMLYILLNSAGKGRG